MILKLLLGIVGFYVFVKIVSFIKGPSEEAMKEEYLEINAAYNPNYKEIAEKKSIGSFEEEIACFLENTYTEENQKKFLNGTYGGTLARAWMERKGGWEQLILYLEQYEELSKYINIAFEHFMNKRYDECNINLRKAIRWMIMIKVDAEGILFESEHIPSIIELIDKFYGETDLGGGMEQIYLNGNASTHAFSHNNDCEADFDSCTKEFKEMREVILDYFSDCKVQCYLEREEIDIRKYLNTFDELVANEYYDDAAVNIRKTLEVVVRKYFDRYEIRCLNGYSKNLCGYIDLLYSKQYISEESKNNMHRIRCISNDGAHDENQNYHVDRGSILKCYELIKKEIEIFEKMSL